MIKTIPQSDIRIRPFKVYKRFQLTQDNLSTGSLSGHQKLIAKKNEVVGDLLTPSASLWASIHRMYYDDIYNPITTFGTISKNVNNSPLLQFRKLEDNAIVFTIPQVKFGEKIKPGSFTIYDSDRNNTFTDSYNADGVLYSDIVDTTWSLFNAETNKFVFVDAALVEYELELISFNADTGLLDLKYNGNPGTLKIKYLNTNTGGIVIFDVTQYTFDFITGFQIAPAGNIFYEHGIAVVTQLEDVNTDFLNYQIDYKSTKTIYENEYFISVDSDEFNYSTNPTAYYEVGATTGSFITGDKIKYRINAGPTAGGFVNYLDDKGSEQTIFIEPNNVYTIRVSKFYDYEPINWSFEEIPDGGSNVLYKIPGEQRMIQKGTLPDGTEYDYRRPFSRTFNSGSKYMGINLTGSLEVSGKYGYGQCEITKSFDGGNRFEYTSSIEIENSLTPYVTTIGLYDENYDMIAVAKLPTPIKVYPDYPVNFLVRIDT